MRPMPSCFGQRILAAAVAAAFALPAAAQDPAAGDSVAAQLQKMQERLQQLEQRNQDLERRVEELSRPAAAAAPGATAAPTTAPAAATAPGSDAEARNQARLEQMERDQRELREQVQSLASPETVDMEAAGPTFEVNLVGVGQGVNADGSDDGKQQGRASFRGDVFVTLPLGLVGDSKSTLVGQLRFGEGNGVSLRPTYTSTVNTTAFQAGAGADQTYAVIAQAYYQLEVPLDLGRFNDQPGNRFEFTIGKLDFFAFFDQNDVAGNEAAQFLNNVFVHNPLLDSGGDIAADQYGFAPGMRLAWFMEGDSSSWGALLGAFGSGDGASFDGNLSGPLVIGQLQYSPRMINGEALGNYRAYVWTNGNTTDLDGAKQRHTGVGVSVDHRIGGELNLFGRYGYRTEGDAQFDTSLTIGGEYAGKAWGRARDVVGLAVGWLPTSSEWKDATRDGTLVGYSASSTETDVELYYRWQVNEHIEVSPDFQMILNPGGDSSADTVYVFGVRGGLVF